MDLAKELEGRSDIALIEDPILPFSIKVLISLIRLNSIS
jgi:hypothetical protein